MGGQENAAKVQRQGSVRWTSLDQSEVAGIRRDGIAGNLQATLKSVGSALLSWGATGGV